MTMSGSISPHSENVSPSQFLQSRELIALNKQAQLTETIANHSPLGADPLDSAAVLSIDNLNRRLVKSVEKLSTYDQAQ